MKTTNLLILTLLCFTCQTQTTSNSKKLDKAFVEEIKQLSTDESKTAYLEAILEIDQKVRIDEDTVLIKYGHDSKEHKAQWDLIRQTDQLNLQKVELYLATYGYPKKGIQSREALTAPYMVIHHQPNNGSRKKNFHYLYKAYKDGDLNSGSFAFFLNRFHATEFGHRLELKSPFREDFEIDTLIKALKLQVE